MPTPAKDRPPLDDAYRAAAERYASLARVVACKFIARRRLGGTAEADDILGAAYLGLCEGMADCDDPGADLVAFLIPNIEWAILDHCQRRRRSRPEESDEAALDAATAPECEDDPRIDDLIDAADRLPPAQSVAFWGSMAGKSSYEIAREIGSLDGSVRSNLAKAVRNLRRMLGVDDPAA